MNGRRGGRRGPAIVVGALLLSAGCGGGPPNPYPQEVVDTFVASCRVRSDERVCRCAIDRLQRRYSLDEFKAFEARISQGEVVKEMIDTVSDCVGK
jgi:hypothetical protein